MDISFVKTYYIVRESSGSYGVWWSLWSRTHTAAVALAEAIDTVAITASLGSSIPLSTAYRQ